MASGTYLTFITLTVEHAASITHRSLTDIVNTFLVMEGINAIIHLLHFKLCLSNLRTLAPGTTDVGGSLKMYNYFPLSQKHSHYKVSTVLSLFDDIV